MPGAAGGPRGQAVVSGGGVARPLPPQHEGADHALEIRRALFDEQFVTLRGTIASADPVGDEVRASIIVIEGTEETPVEGADAADLEVTKVDNVPVCAVPSDLIRYTISYTNNSFSIAAEDVEHARARDARDDPSGVGGRFGPVNRRAPGLGGLCELVEGMDMVRMVNSGTEATMSAVRVARGALTPRKTL